jgi:hypothetical protein
VSVLNDGTGQQYAERNRFFSKQGKEKQMRARFLNKSHKRGNRQHNELILLYPIFKMEMIYQQMHEK